MSLAKNWCFTINNPSNEDLERLQALEENDLVTYCVFQKERGTEGTTHFQGYIQLGRKKRMAGVKTLVGSRAHVEVARGTAEQNRAYCTKEDTRIGNKYEFGNMMVRGKRSDIVELVEASKEHSIDENFLMQNFPEILAKYPRFCTRLRAIQEEKNVERRLFVPQVEWQRGLQTYLAGEPDPRKVRWYYDQVGGSGKSTMANSYVSERFGLPYVVTGGKHGDIFYAYCWQRIIFFDYARAQEETFPYAVLEAFKNGYFLSSKYEPRTMRFNIPHVVVFANFEPDKTKLSMDRWDIHRINVIH